MTSREIITFMLGATFMAVPVIVAHFVGARRMTKPANTTDTGGDQNTTPFQRRKVFVSTNRGTGRDQKNGRKPEGSGRRNG